MHDAPTATTQRTAEASQTAENIAAARRGTEALIAALRGDGARVEDPHAIHAVADLVVRRHVAETVAARAGETLAAGLLAAEAATAAAQTLFDLTGSRDGFAALATGPTPVRRAQHAIGDHVVNGVVPRL